MQSYDFFSPKSLKSEHFLVEYEKDLIILHDI